MPEQIIWDTKSFYVFTQTEKKKFDIIKKRYKDFINIVNDVNTNPVKVFDDLRADQKAELELIREASRELQSKKDMEIMKANAAAEATGTEDKEKKTEESNEEPKPVTQ